MRTTFSSTASFSVEPLEKRELFAAAPANLADTEHLTKTDVTRILAAAASQALTTQVITVVDRDGQILGIVAMKNANLSAVKDNLGNNDDPLLRTVTESISRARTGAFFESHQDAFTTRTARFIIQDHFPQPLPNTSGGPLYGVEFSSLPGSDVYSGPGVSGDPGGIPLFKNGVPVGGIGVAGDGSDRIARGGLPYNPLTLPNPKKSANSSVNLFDGDEEHDVDEQVALAGATKFMAPKAIQATNIIVAGLRFPFTADQPAGGHAARTLDQITTSGAGSLIVANQSNTGLPFVIAAPYSTQTSATPRSSPGSPFSTTTIGGIVGELKNTNPRTPNHGIIGSNETFVVAHGKNKVGDPLPDAARLTKHDVQRIITSAVQEALDTRAGIRVPIGVSARVHIAVVDRNGNILGVFRMQDGTNFSYDVAVQKARTAAFFSDNKHAFSARAIGFLSQKFFPAGIDSGLEGPLFQLQNQLSLGPYTVKNTTDFGVGNRAATLMVGSTTVMNPLQNGITLFPGGAPLYKNGQFVGAIGVSGDGVDQDDIITFAGTKDFKSTPAIRSDHLSETKIVNFLTNRLNRLDTLYDLDESIVEDDRDKLKLGLDDVQLPFQKFPRNSQL